MAKGMILIVEDEDEDDLRFNLRYGLESHGYQVQLASEGIGAIQRLVEHPEITTIVSDLRMPIFGGEYWLKFLTHFCAGRYQIILQTGMRLPNMPPGMKVVMKPYSIEQLLEAIEKS